MAAGNEIGNILGSTGGGAKLNTTELAGLPEEAFSKDSQNNYVTANRFYVEMGSANVAAFAECSSLSVKIDHEKIHEGGANDRQRILIKQAQFDDITLKRGITNNFAFWNWTHDVMTGKVQRRNINILVYNQAGKVMQAWGLKAAVPVGWKTPALQADAKVVAIEELTLAYETIEVSNAKLGGAILLKPGRGLLGEYTDSIL